MIKGIIERYSASKKGKVSFVQIGAHDGKSQDYIYPFIKKYNWGGYRIEPMPQLFHALSSRHAKDKNIKCLNVAISDQDGEAEIYYVMDSEDNPLFANHLNSFSKEVILKHKEKIPNLIDKIDSILIDTLTWNTFIASEGLNQVDAIFIDTEGYDYEILKQIDLVQLQIDFVVFEHKHLEKEDLMSCLKGFHDMCYHIIVDEQDTMAVSPKLFELLFVMNSSSETLRSKIFNHFK